MRRKALKKTSLVFARRKTTISRGKRGKTFFNSKKMFIALGIIFLGAGSVYAGHLFARTAPAPFFMKNKAPNVVLQPVVEAKENKTSLEELLREKNIEFEGVSYATTSATAIITLQKNSFVYLDISENIEGQVGVLSNVLGRIKIENPGKNISYIDLRYKRPLIKF